MNPTVLLLMLRRIPKGNLPLTTAFIGLVLLLSIIFESVKSFPLFLFIVFVCPMFVALIYKRGGAG